MAEKAIDTRAGRARAVQIMGIVNVTPDSFSDGGRWQQVEQAVAHAEDLVAEGATIIDVGGESTRPGAARVPLEVEQARVLPVVAELAARGMTVSVDTLNAVTAEKAVAAGATIINDVSGGLADAGMASVAAATEATFIAMHWRGHSDTMQQHTDYVDVVAEVADHLAARIDALTTAGVTLDRLVIDPGLGFAKTAEQNWLVLGHLQRFTAMAPVLVGASRKRFLAELLATDSPATDRDLPTAVVSALAAGAGAWGVRVHDVASTRIALGVAAAWSTAHNTIDHRATATGGSLA